MDNAGKAVPPTAESAQARAGVQGRGTPERVLEDLSRVDLLRALPPEEVQAIVPYVERIRFSAGQQVFSQGDAGDALYLIDEGDAQVLLDHSRELARLGPGDSFGEIALLTGEPRSATVTALTDLTVWCILREEFERVTQASPRLEAAVRELAARHRAGLELSRAAVRSPEWWRGTALRSIAARRRGLAGWQKLMFGGFVLWAALFFWDIFSPSKVEATLVLEASLAILRLVTGLLILQGACESLILSVERLGARLRWDGYVAGTMGEILSTLPEFVVIIFVVQVEPLAAFLVAVVTIYNNGLIFSVYSFFLPKDRQGTFLMPAAITKAGTEVLIAGAGLNLILGLVMLALKTETHKSSLDWPDLFLVSGIMFIIFGYYVYTLVRYYAEEPEERLPAHPHVLGHPTGWGGIIGSCALGILGAVLGGESVSGFAETALHTFHLPQMPTAIVLAFFAGISELVIVYKAHRRGELSIALSNVFGGVTQVMFLVVPFTFLVIGLYSLTTGDVRYVIPIDFTTTSLIMLLFPLFFVLLHYIEKDHTLSSLDGAAMTGIYVLLLYLLVFTGQGD